MQSHIFTDAHMDAPEFVAAARVRVGIFSSRSPDPDHDRNEDAAAVFEIDENRAVFALADGVGGVRGGDLASSIAIEQLQLAIESGLQDAKNLRACIVDAFENANRIITEKGIGAATTLAVIEVDSGTVRPYHAGDTEIIASGLRGKLKLQTLAHSPVAYAVESGIIDEQEAMQHDDRHVVSNFVGSPDMRIEIGSSLSLARRDTVILASDGLTDNLHTDEIIEMIRKGPLDAVMKRIASEVAHRMHHSTGDHPSKPDDLTFLVFRRTE